MVGRRIFGLGLLLSASLMAATGSFAADRPVRIAVVDTGNTGRSVTAEALAWGRKAAVACRAPVEVRPFH